jgi:1,4-dihydroxy-2-naphthoate octaprenyltransferase
MSYLQKVKLFYRTVRLPFITASSFPVLLGALEAAREGYFDALLFVLTLVGIVLIHFGLNTANDFFDTRLGADAVNPLPTPFSGGSRVIIENLVSEKNVKRLFTICYTLGTLIGLYLALTRGLIPILGLMSAGFFLSFFYTAPPLKLAYRGFGELSVFLGFGPVLVLGSYYVQAQRFSTEALWISIPSGLLIMLILYVNEIPDRPWDAKAGKRTMVVRMPKEKVILVYVSLIALLYIFIALGAIAGLLPLYSLIALVTAMWIPKMIKTMKEKFEKGLELIPLQASQFNLFIIVNILLTVSYLLSLSFGG